MLSGIGINKSLALSSTTKMPTTRFVNSGGVGQRGRTTFSRYFSIDVARTEALMDGVPSGIAVVSESGIAHPEQLWRLRERGVRAVLVGESLMRAPDPAAALTALVAHPAGADVPAS